jgi:hypothetical protein
MPLRKVGSRFCRSFELWGPRFEIDFCWSGSDSELFPVPFRVYSWRLCTSDQELQTDTMPRESEANLPPTNEGYGTKEYWCVSGMVWLMVGTSGMQSERGLLDVWSNSSEPPATNFDWFLSPTYLLPMFEELTRELGKETRILMLGCGNSQLGEVVCVLACLVP